MLLELLTLHLPQHPDEHRPENPIFLAVDQQLGEGAGLGVPPELSDPVGTLGIGKHQDVEQLGAGAGPRASRRSRSRPRARRVSSSTSPGRLLDDGVDGVLEDLPLSASAGRVGSTHPLPFSCLAVLERVWTLSALAGVVARAAI
jgi:hypothetical protein